MQGFPNNPNRPGLGNNPNRPGIGGSGGIFNPRDPSFRSEISLTIDFRVTSSMDDNKAPWVKVSVDSLTVESIEENCESCGY